MLLYILMEFKRVWSRLTNSSLWSRNVIGNSFATWTMEQVSDWLEDEGLSAYIPTFTKALSRGDDVFKLSSQEMERDLGITLPIHQKKLQYALKVILCPLENTRWQWILCWWKNIWIQPSHLLAILSRNLSSFCNVIVTSPHRPPLHNDKILAPGALLDEITV